jgi:hypothetical protein
MTVLAHDTSPAAPGVVAALPTVSAPGAPPGAFLAGLAAAGAVCDGGGSSVSTG